MSTLPQTFTNALMPVVKPPAPRRKMRGNLVTMPCLSKNPDLRTSYQGSGHPAADFASVYQTYHRRIYSQCFYMLHNHIDAEDAAQEVFLQLYRKVHTFRGESRFSTWLHRLTVNCVLMELRRKRRRGREISPEDAPAGSCEAELGTEGSLDNFQAPAIRIFDRITLTAALAKLPSGYQRILHMHDIEGFTHAEIAEFLGINIGTSKSQLHRARLQLRRLLQAGRRRNELQ
jgi:RNA polymerase sigma-70 factor (ECF subfamily)